MLDFEYRSPRSYVTTDYNIKSKCGNMFVKKKEGVEALDCSTESWFIVGILFRGAKRFVSILYSYFMPVCSIVKTITPRCRGRPDALVHEAEGRVQ